MAGAGRRADRGSGPGLRLGSRVLLSGGGGVVDAGSAQSSVSLVVTLESPNSVTFDIRDGASSNESVRVNTSI